MSSSALQTQLVGTEHIPSQNILGSVGITNIPAVTLIGPSSVAVTNAVALAAGTEILGSVNVGGSIAVLSMPAVQVTPVQFGLSSVVTGQRTMAASLPVTLASDQPSIVVTTTGGGSVVVLGGSVALIPPALVTPVQFGLSSTLVGQTTPALSVPVVLAANQVLGSVAISGGSVNVGGSVVVLSLPAAQVTPIQFGLSSVTTGQRTMSLSLSVTMASDQPAISVTGAAGAGSVNVLGGTVGLIPGDVRRVQFGLSSTVMGQTTPALSVPVVLAANQVLGSVQLSGGTVQLLAGTAILGSVNVGGSVAILSMPNPVQQVQFGLSSATLGQQARATSLPVTLSSDQNFVDVQRRAIRTLVPAYQYQDIPRVSINVTLGSTGALGDWLELLLCMVSTAGGARVSVRDGTVGEVINLIPQTPGPGIGPYHIVFGYPSRHGAWQISTDSGVSVRASGIFT